MAAGRKERFTTRWGFILTAMGAAIGTGNIWRFPMKAATYGGGSFIIPWLLFLFIWSIPLLMAEFALGKATRMGTIGTFKKFLGKRFAWMGVWMVFVSTAINFYYAVVMGWVIRYFIVSGINGTQGDTRAVWNAFVTNPVEVIAFQAIAIIIGVLVVQKGIKKGIERTNLFLMPMLFVLLIITAAWALSLPHSIDGFVYLFTPQNDPSGTPYLMRADTWINALAQSAWSCSAGMGMAITYSVYMRRKEDTNLNAYVTGLGNNSASLIAGLAVFATVFALSSNPTEVMHTDATALTFIHLTHLFNMMPFGFIIAMIFFLATSFAALTSLISGFEVAVRNFMDAGYDRTRAVRIIGVATFIMGLPSAAIIGYVNGEPTPMFLENQDNVWGLGLIISGLFLAFAVWRYGAENFRQTYINTQWSDVKIGRWWSFLITYVFPVLFVILIGWYMVDTYTAVGERWWMSGPTGLAFLLIQWGAVLTVILLLNNRIAEKINTPEDEYTVEVVE